MTFENRKNHELIEELKEVCGIEEAA